MFYEIHTEEIIDHFIPSEMTVNMNAESRGSTQSLLAGLMHSISFGFLYGVGFVAARSLWAKIQQFHPGRDISHQESGPPQATDRWLGFVRHRDRFNIHSLVKRITSSYYYKKSLGWLTLWTLHSYYLSFVHRSSSYINSGQTFFWSMYPILFTLAITATDSLEENGTHGETPTDKFHPDTTTILPHSDSLCSEVHTNTNSNVDELEPSITLGTSDSLLGKSRSDSIATLNSAEPDPTSPNAFVASTSTTTTNSRYLELLVHNVSHTDLVLNLTLPAIQNLQQCDGKISHTSSKDDIPTNSKASTPRTNHQRSSWWLYSTTKSDLKAPSRPPSAAVDEEILTGTSEDEPSNLILCRPRFSAFDLFCRRALSVLKQIRSQDGSTPNPTDALQSAIMSFPHYERSDSTLYSLVTPRPSRQLLLPVGFNLKQLMVQATDSNKAKDSMLDLLKLDKGDLLNLRIRGRDLSKMDPVYNADPTTSQELQIQAHIDAVFFPLLSSLMRRWQEQIRCKFGGNGSNKKVKKVLILVSGVGTPRNYTHSPTGNSTEACAELMETFIHTLYPDVTVVRLHSKTEIFRYDENIKFATRELMPCIDAYRDAHARGESYPDERGGKTNPSSLNPFDPDWKQTFSVTLSFADGAPARTHAIQAALRPYRPQYFHFWQLKTFWHDAKICDDDVEVHSFEDMETVPAMEIGKTNSQVQMVVAEVKKFRESFLDTVRNERNDIRQFWLRKTKKPVLAVLLVEQAGRLVMYRGTNMEVSMPTGSLCAERSVIGAAFASNPGLRREDLRMVAVLAVPLPFDELGPAPPSLIPSSPYLERGNSRKISIGFPKLESTSLLSEVESKLTLSERREVTRSMSVGSFASIVENDDFLVSHDDDSSLVLVSSDRPLEDSASALMKHKKSALIPRETKEQDYSGKDISVVPSSTGTVNPMRRIKLYADGDELHSPSLQVSNNAPKRKQKRTVLVHFSDDLNPLRPCGACNEWLKKIAECNPYFKIITFTDADCNGVYVMPCQD